MFTPLSNPRSERAAATAEYAVCTVAAAAFAAILWLLLPFFNELIQSIISLNLSVWLRTGPHPILYLPK